MDTIQSDKRHSPSVTEERQAPVERMQRAGIAVRFLEVTEVKSGLHESAEGITAWPIYRISWHKQPLRLLGLWSLPRTNDGSGRFVKISPQRINMPSEGSRRYDIAHSAAEVDESAVFLSTQLADSHLNLILAVRIQDQWLEVYRWSSSWAKLGITRLDICSF
jgi:hypothetical protein